MCQVVLIRSGATLYDEEKRVQGVLDIPLSERGQGDVAQMAECLARELNGCRPRALYCGPGAAVTHTAEIVGRTLGLRPRKIDELRNLDQGLWQGLQVEEIRRRNNRLYRQWLDDPETICPPRGEPVESAKERIRAVIKPLLKRHQGETIGLVVGEPLARLVACILKCEPRVHLDDMLAGACFETIEAAPSLSRNGTHTS